MKWTGKAWIWWDGAHIDNPSTGEVEAKSLDDMTAQTKVEQCLSGPSRSKRKWSCSVWKHCRKTHTVPLLWPTGLRKSTCDQHGLPPGRGSKTRAPRIRDKTVQGLHQWGAWDCPGMGSIKNTTQTEGDWCSIQFKEGRKRAECSWGTETAKSKHIYCSVARPGVWGHKPCRHPGIAAPITLATRQQNHWDWRALSFTENR